MFNQILKEPLLHIILMGGAIFWVYAQLNPTIEEDNSIVINKSEFNRLIKEKAKEKTYGLSIQEATQLKQDYVNKEILFREAKRLGLDHDAFIRERMIQKAQFYLEGQFIAPDVDESTLKQFYHDNQSAYQKGLTMSFEHRVINADGTSQISKLLSLANSEEKLLARTKPFLKNTLVSPSFERASLVGLKKIFGESFAQKVTKQPLNKWSGLIESDLGFHIVKLTHLEENSVKSYEEIESQVKNDWLSQQRARWLEEKLVALQEHYEITYQ